jgi:hypothetical protein
MRRWTSDPKPPGEAAITPGSQGGNMNRKPIVFAAIATAVIASAALAQEGPDFSPSQPRGVDPLGTQSAPDAPYAAPVSPAPDLAAPPVTTRNPQLEAYEQSAPPLPADAVPVEPRTQTVIVTPAPIIAPGQSTIGGGLFNRRGPNDFGA